MLAVIALSAAIVWPSVSAAFGRYHIERAAEDMQTRLSRVRLNALERGVPYAFSYSAGTDQFWTWACEPLETQAGLSGVSSPLGAVSAGSPSGDLYDRRHFELNDRPDNREFWFVPVTAAEAIAATGLSADTIEFTGTSTQSVAASNLLAQGKLGLALPSVRSTAALQIPGLQIFDATDPVVFEPDGTADKDAVIRIADGEDRYVEIVVHGVSGAITTSAVRQLSELAGSQLSLSRAVGRQKPALRSPSRSREIRQSPGGAE